MSIVFTAGQHRPGDASQLVGDGYDDFVAWSTLCEWMHPLPKSSRVVLDAKQHRTSTVDQHATQINVAALADAVQSRFAPGGVLSGHNAHPRCKIASAAKGRSVANGDHGGGGDQRTEAWNLTELPAARILITDALNRMANRLHVALDLFPLLPQPIQQPAQPWARVLLGIFNNSGEVVAQVDGVGRINSSAVHIRRIIRLVGRGVQVRTPTSGRAELEIVNLGDV
jgi:hypothetical protein